MSVLIVAVHAAQREVVAGEEVVPEQEETEDDPNGFENSILPSTVRISGFLDF